MFIARSAVICYHPRHERLSSLHRTRPLRRHHLGQGRRVSEPARSVAHRGRAAARGEPRRSRHQCGDGAGQGRRPQAARPGREDRSRARQAARGDQDRDRGAGLHQPDARSGGVAHGARRHRPRRRRLWPRHRRRGQAGERRIRLGQSDRPDARRPLPRRGVRRCARQSARGRRLCGDARVLHQRRRRAGRCPGALGVPALPRGARREYRRHPRTAFTPATIWCRWARRLRKNTATSSRPCRRASGCR